MTHTRENDRQSEFSLMERGLETTQHSEFGLDGAASAALFVEGEDPDQQPDIDTIGSVVTPILDEFTQEVNGTPDPDRFVVTRKELRALAVRGFRAGYQAAQSNDGVGGGA